MSKPASEVMQAVIIAAVTEAIEALKAGAKGLPNNLLRDLQSVHPNARFDELPKALQDSINLSVRSAFNQLLKEGYAVGPKAEMQSRPMDRVPERPRGGPGGDRRGAPGQRFNRGGEGRRGPGGPGRGPGGPGRGPSKGPRPGGGAPKK